MRKIDADALLEELEKMRFPGAPYVDAGVEIAIGKVCEAPDIEPERKKGRWIPQDYNQRHGNISTTVYYYPKCSVCGCSGDYTDAFCKSCGADMRGEQNG